MKKLVVALSLTLAAPAAQAQTVDLFRNDPIGYFTGDAADGWVGTGTYFQVNYNDTLLFAPDSTGKGLVIRRVLVNADLKATISHGFGHIVPLPGDSAYSVYWNEKAYPAVNGTMRWQESQWIISFDGEWKQWSIRVRQDEPGALVAAAARMVPGFRPVELTSMTYKALAP